MDKIEHLLEHHKGTDADETTQQSMTTVFDVLQCIYIANDPSVAIQVYDRRL